MVLKHSSRLNVANPFSFLFFLCPASPAFSFTRLYYCPLSPEASLLHSHCPSTLPPFLPLPSPSSPLQIVSSTSLLFDTMAAIKPDYAEVSSTGPYALPVEAPADNTVLLFVFKVDRFSALPNEILNTILDLAHPESQHGLRVVPPSKRFLSLYRDRLYCEVVLQSPKALTAFAYALNEDLVTGGGVKAIEFRAASLPATARSSVDAIFDMCPNMTSLSCPFLSGAVYWSIFERVQCGTGFRNLRQLTLPWFDDPEIFHPQSLLWLEELQQLDDLTILDLPAFDSVPDSYELALKIRYFKLVGGATLGIGARLILSTLKNLISLRITPSGGAAASDWGLETALLTIQAPLETLSLVAAEVPYLPNLSRFTSLHTLVLHSQSIQYFTSRISGLPSTITTLKVNGVRPLEETDLLHITNFVNSRQNPGFHKQIKHLEINLAGVGGGHIGSRICSDVVDDSDSNDSDFDNDSDSPRGNDSPSTHWQLPFSFALSQSTAYRSFVHPNSGTFKLTGTLIDAFETTEAFLLELHNRAVLSEHLDEDVGDIRGIKASQVEGYQRLSIEIAEGERPDLELVRDYLPERKWFALSLRNRSNGRTYGRWRN